MVIIIRVIITIVGNSKQLLQLYFYTYPVVDPRFLRNYPGVAHTCNDIWSEWRTLKNEKH